jgi:disulfide bond formation protein DsbB
MPILFTMVVLGCAAWFDQSRRFPAMTRIMQSNLRYVLGGTLFLTLILTAGISVNHSWQETNKEAAFERKIWQPLGNWIKENSTPDATVALESIGGVGWYSERYIWDEGGLVSARTYMLNEETPGDINVMAILQRYHPDLYIAWNPWELKTYLCTPAEQAWFNENYAFVNSYKDGRRIWTLFRSRSSEKVRENPVTDHDEAQVVDCAPENIQ